MTVTRAWPKSRSWLHLGLSICFFGTVAIGARPVFAQSMAELVLEKDLEIRNLRRRIFDLESQMPDDLQGQKLRAELKASQVNFQQRQNQLEADYASQINQLKDQIKKLEKALADQKKAHEKEMTEEQSRAEGVSKDIEKKLKQRDEQLLKTNEVLTSTMAERTNLGDQLKVLQAEIARLEDENKTMSNDVRKLRKKQDVAISKAQKPLKTKIVKLEDDFKELQQTEQKRYQQIKKEQEEQQKEFAAERGELRAQLRDKAGEIEKWEERVGELEKQWGADKQNHDKLLERLHKEMDTKDKELLSASQRADGFEKQIAQLKDELKARDTLELAMKADHQKALKENNQKNNDAIKSHEELLQREKENVLKLEQKLQSVTKDHELQLAQWQKELAEKEQAVSKVEERVVKAEEPLRMKIASQTQQIDQLQKQLDTLQDSNKVLVSQSQDEEEKIAVYKKLVAKQEEDLNALRSELTKSSMELEKTLAAEKAPLIQKAAELDKQVVALNKQLQLKRMEITQENAGALEEARKELASTRIDLDYQKNLNKKMEKNQERLENTLLALEKKNDLLSQQVKSFNSKEADAQEARTTTREVLEAKAELEERIEILLVENAEYQKKVMELTQSMEEIADATQMAEELSEAQDIIRGFKKDVDAKTIEISGLASENHDLRKMYRKTIQEMDDLKDLVKRLKEEKMAQVSSAEMAEMQEQLNSLRTALSTARQLIAQKDVAIEDMSRDRELMQSDITKLTEQLSDKIKAVGELEYAKRNNFDGYTDEELQAVKKPLLLEISVLKQRIAHLEEQLVETWDRAEGMLLELKNHPQIKQADGKLSREAQPSVR